MFLPILSILFPETTTVSPSASLSLVPSKTFAFLMTIAEGELESAANVATFLARKTAVQITMQVALVAHTVPSWCENR